MRAFARIGDTRKCLKSLAMGCWLIIKVMANTALYNSLDSLAHYRLRDTRAGDLVV